MHPTITLKLQGGLGNQLFQYAAGRALAQATGASLALDLFHLYSTQAFTRLETPRIYELYPYAIHAQLVQPADSLLCHILPARVKRFLWSDIHYRKFPKRIGEDKEIAEVNQLLSENRSVLLEGFFQNECYFSSIRDILLEELRLREELPSEYMNWADKAAATASVAVHIRRGDYVHNPSARVYHGTLPESYYREALQLLSQKLGNPAFFFFSDDMDWVENIFRDVQNSIFVKSSASTPHIDLELMRLCKNQVIANSSFSWWGAWLNTYEDKLVIAPKKWFADPAENAKIVLPEKWLRI